MRIWSLRLQAGKTYPLAAPSIRFVSKINADFVDAKGNVIPSKVPYLNGWKPSGTMAAALNDIKNLIARAPRSQPAEGAEY